MIKKITSLIILTTFFISCNDDFMEKYPLTTISDQTFWNTENDLAVYNNTFYHYARSGAMRLLYGHESGSTATLRAQYSQDGATDNDVRSPDYNSGHVIVRSGQIIPDNNPLGFGWNNTCFNFVRAINIGLANYDRADAPQSDIDKYKSFLWHDMIA